MRVFLLAMLLSMCVTGCITRQGRFVGIELDLRDEQQIAAGKVESMAPYMDGDNALPTIAEDKMEIRPLTWWERMFDVLRVIKGRLRIVVIEWDK
jgi:hypothetical protein